jgi:hypothetical protein
MPKTFAEIIDGQVTRVIVAESIDWCESRLGGTWIETKIDGSERVRYAGVGYVYRADLDAFLPPQPAWNYSVDGVTKNWTFPDGDHLYIPADPRLIEALSRGLYMLIDPNREGLYAGIVWHPTGEQWPLLQLRSDDIVPISLGANAEPLTQVLSAFVDGGGLTQEELDGIVGAVTSMAGQTVQIRDMIPQSWQQYVMTREQAQSAGYF